MEPIVRRLCYLMLPLAFFALPAFAAESAHDHLFLLASYEQMMVAQDQVIAEHEQMKQDLEKKFYVNEKLTPRTELQRRQKECDASIEQAKKMKSVLLDYARWHRMRLEELEGH